MGAVYEAQNLALGKRVALKFIDAEAARNRESVQRFIREAQAAGAVESLHIVQVFDVGEDSDGHPFIVMEMLRGENLAQRLARMGRLPLSEAVHICVQALRGLRKAHETGIVHRDLKPENLFLVDTDDDPIFTKVVDFGISKIIRQARDIDPGTLTRQGVVLGTPHYMSPEQAQAMPDVDARTDLWAMGAILFECLTGRRPYPGKTYEQVIVSICTKDVPDVRTLAPHVPDRIAEVVRRALARDRAERFQNADEFIEGIRGAAPEFVSANPPTSFDAAPVVQVPRPQPAEAPATGSRVSWATTGHAGPTVPPRRGSWRMVALGTGVTIVAFAVTLGIMRVSRGSGVAMKPLVDSSPQPSAVPLRVELRVVTVPPQASVIVDGKPVDGGVIAGPRQSSHRVFVEAEGYASRELTVVLDGLESERRVELEPVAAQSDAGKARPSSGLPRGSSGSPASSREPGIAVDLKLKVEGP